MELANANIALLVSLLPARERIRIPLNASTSDKIEDTINYSELFTIVKTIVEGKPYNLLEKVAKRISDKILVNYDIYSVSVTIKKPEVSIKDSNLDYAAITLTQYKNK